jgi:hypothetical protein
MQPFPLSQRATSMAKALMRMRSCCLSPQTRKYVKIVKVPQRASARRLIWPSSKPESGILDSNGPSILYTFLPFRYKHAQGVPHAPKHGQARAEAFPKEEANCLASDTLAVSIHGHYHSDGCPPSRFGTDLSRSGRRRWGVIKYTVD